MVRTPRINISYYLIYRCDVTIGDPNFISIYDFDSECYDQIKSSTSSQKVSPRWKAIASLAVY